MNCYNPNLYQNYLYQQPQGLNGKIVDSEASAKMSDVPFGMYGFFPKADMSEIYVKTWNPNGTTSLYTYKPIEPQTEQHIDERELIRRLEDLERKVDLIQQPQQKKEVRINEF